MGADGSVGWKGDASQMLISFLVQLLTARIIIPIFNLI